MIQLLPAVYYFTQSVEYFVKIDQHTAAKNLDNIVQRFAGIVANARVRIAETAQYGRHQITAILLSFLSVFDNKYPVLFENNLI